MCMRMRMCMRVHAYVHARACTVECAAGVHACALHMPYTCLTRACLCGRRYVNAGTVEFLVDPKTWKHYFIEVNPRIQVRIAPL